MEKQIVTTAKTCDSCKHFVVNVVKSGRGFWKSEVVLDWCKIGDFQVDRYRTVCNYYSEI